MHVTGMASGKQQTLPRASLICCNSCSVSRSSFMSTLQLLLVQRTLAYS